MDWAGAILADPFICWSEQEIDERLSRLIKEAFYKVRHFSHERGVPNRIAALAVGIARVDRTMRWRGLYA